MMQGMVTGSVNEIFHAGNGHEPSGNEFKIAMANHIEGVESQHIGIKHGNGSTSHKERTQQGNGKHGSVH